MFEPDTRSLRRVMSVGLAKQDSSEVVATVRRLRRRGHSYRSILGYLGPRQCCPLNLRSVFDRVALLASAEPA